MEIFLFIFPLLNFLLFQFFNHKIRTGLLYSLSIFLFGLTFILSLYIFFKIINLDKDLPLFFYSLIKFDSLFVDWTLRFDLLVAVLIILVTFIGLLLIIYSTVISKNHSTNFKINSYISFSIFGVLVLISSNNLIQFFLGWYLIILSSYLISNMSKNKIDNSNIFFQNRVSDLCFFFKFVFHIYFFKFNQL